MTADLPTSTRDDDPWRCAGHRDLVAGRVVACSDCGSNPAPEGETFHEPGPIGRLILGRGDIDPEALDIPERIVAILPMYRAPASGFARCEGETRQGGYIGWFRVETQGVGWTTTLAPDLELRVRHGQMLRMFVAVDPDRDGASMLCLTSPEAGA